MARSKARLSHCLLCGAPASEDNPISTRGKCKACGIENAVQAALEMAAQSGPAWDRWVASRGPKGRPETPWSPYSRVRP